MLNDSGRISPTNVFSVVHVKSEKDIQKAIQEAKGKRISISIMGVKHSQGGQSLVSDGIALDMLGFNKVIALDKNKKQVTVQSGIRWGDLQKFINPYNLAVTSMQSPNIFTVGGSMSVNAHGDDFRAGPVKNSVVAFHLILADGKKLFVTEKNHPELWSAVLGGYGLFGVITDVTLQLTDNSILISDFLETEVHQFPAFFQKQVFANPNTTLFFAHLNISPGKNFLRNMYVIIDNDTHQLPTKVIKLDNPDKWNRILAPVFNISRHGKVGKATRWLLEKKILSKEYYHKLVTRNNAMEKPVRFASDYYNKHSVDWLQEYFIPLDQFEKFIDQLRQIMSANKVNLLNVTVRYVPAENDIDLSYAKQNCFAVVLYFNQPLSPIEISKSEMWTQKLIDAALSLHGNYYLPYQPFALLSQFQKAYPNYQKLLNLKKKIDPEEMFSNEFFLHYF